MTKCLHISRRPVLQKVVKLLSMVYLSFILYSFFRKLTYKFAYFNLSFSIIKIMQQLVFL